MGDMANKHADPLKETWFVVLPPKDDSALDQLRCKRWLFLCFLLFYFRPNVSGPSKIAEIIIPPFLKFRNT